MKNPRKIIIWLLIIGLFAFLYQSNITDKITHKKTYIEGKIYEDYGDNRVTEFIRDQFANLDQFPIKVKDYYFFSLGVYVNDAYDESKDEIVTLAIANRVYFIEDWFEEKK